MIPRSPSAEDLLRSRARGADDERYTSRGGAQRGGDQGSASSSLLRIDEVARRCSVSTRTLWSWIAVGRLPVLRLSRRVVRVEESALADFLAHARDGQP